MNELKNAVREKVITFVTAAFGLVAGLAWNEAVQALIQKFFVADENSLAAKFIYAIAVTIIATLVIVYLERLSKIKIDKIDTAAS